MAAKKKKVQSVPEDIIKAMVAVSRYVTPNSEIRWIDMKKMMLLSLHPDRRKLFSTRDRRTYEQHPNEMEVQLIGMCKELTGLTLTALPHILTGKGK
jgi:hypothetical protein